MNRCLAVGLLALVGYNSAHAIYQWDIWQSDLNQVACWNPNSCTATDATVHIYNDEDPAEQYLVHCNIFLSGQPLAYNLQADADQLVDFDSCENGVYMIDELWVNFAGPGFHYEYTNTQLRTYSCGPNMPNRVLLPAGDGCITTEPVGDWTFANYPNGVAITSDYSINDTRIVDPGMEVYLLPGISLTINGTLNAYGDTDNWINFTGENWNGIIVGNGGRGNFEHCKFTNAMSTNDGGAFEVLSGGSVSIVHSLITGNHSNGMGGAIYIANGGVAAVYNSTISHNSATVGGGGVYLGGATCLFESGMNLITFNSPVNSDVTGTGFTNVSFTNIYPQNSGFPAGMVTPAWYCDPGYVNPTLRDFHISYWSLTDPTEVNCIIDVSVNELENDPDGTPGDMGAFYFDQHAILNPAVLLNVVDRPNDQGGYVLLSFHASPNDGSWLNPITMYSIWVQYPGMTGDNWVAAGTVAAVANPNMTYVVAVPTLDDQYAGFPNIHNFMVGTHSVHFPVPMPSETMQGFSLDNIAPMPVTGWDNENWAYDQWPPTQDRLPLSWNINTANDFDHFIIKASLVENYESAPVIYVGTETDATFTLPFGQLEAGEIVYFWSVAVDSHGNMSEPTPYEVVYVTVADRLPTAFELGQNYPNPFNPSTSIAFALPVAGKVELSVYNMMGAKVTTLVNETKPAGRYTATFNAANLASGVYFYRLETPSFTDMKKMILVK